MKHRLIAALDTADRAQAINWAEAVAPSCGLLKLGLEFFAAHGPQGVASLGQRPVFLDLKLFDIPNTVAGAVRALGAVRPAMLTLHASGGAAMVAAARAARDQATPGTKLLAVTVLTSFDEAGMHQVGVAGSVPAQVMRLARVALAAGADGLVCSAHEVAALRAEFGSAPILVVPGIRPAGVAVHDQARVMTPAQAVQAGADYLVVGRPITEAADPGGMAAAIAAEAA